MNKSGTMAGTVSGTILAKVDGRWMIKNILWQGPRTSEM